MNSDLLIISARWVIPVEPASSVLTDHSIVIENGVIKAICNTQDAFKEYPNAQRIERPNHALIPGLINAHTHAAMNLFRGLADDIPLMDWLNSHIWPAEQKCVDAEFMRDGSQLAIAEMLLSGTTCFNDMYFYPDIVATQAQNAGIRASVGMIILDFPSIWAKDANEYFDKGVEVLDGNRSLSGIQTTIAPHAPYTVSDEPLLKARTYADELNVPIHMHIHETQDEIAGSMEQYGQRPLARLDELGLLSPRMMAVHMTQLNESEIELIAAKGVHVVHCPRSNQKLASGVCPIDQLITAQVNVCLGTDSAASNNDLNMLGEMRSAALQAKNHSANAASVSAAEVLQMATLNAAKALNMQEEIGSLVVGKSADLVAINLNNVATQPVYDPIAQIVYSASREQISDVWVNGRQLVKDKQLTKMDLEKILNKAEAWRDRIRPTNESL